MKIVLKKADVLRPEQADMVNEIEKRFELLEGEAEVSGRSRRGTAQG